MSPDWRHLINYSWGELRGFAGRGLPTLIKSTVQVLSCEVIFLPVNHTIICKYPIAFRQFQFVMEAEGRFTFKIQFMLYGRGRSFLPARVQIFCMSVDHQAETPAAVRSCDLKYLFVQVYCICQLPESSDSWMFECENWFHFCCMGLTAESETWICPECAERQV